VFIMCMGQYLGMKMTRNDEWLSLINQSLSGENTPKTGDIPSVLPLDNASLGTKESSINAGYRAKSPESPKSPLKKEGKGKDDNLNACAGELDGKFFCDKYRGVDTLVNMKIAPSKGVECGQCDHLKMLQFSRPKDRRLFHWRCVKGFNILEAGFGGERILIAPSECNQYHDFNGAK